MSPVLSFIKRRGERVWLRNVSRYVDYATGEAKEVYVNNQSCIVRISEHMITDAGQSILLPSGKAVLYGFPLDFFNASITVQLNDLIIRVPDNYSEGTSTIWRVYDVRRQPIMNQSSWYVRLDLELTSAKE